MDFSGEDEAGDALATPAAQAEILPVSPRLVVPAVLLGDDVSLVAVSGPATLLLLVFLLVAALTASTQGLGTESRRMGNLSGLGAEGYTR